MGKRRTPKRNSHTRTIPLPDEVYRALQEQSRRFAEKFGREPGPDDPIFFDFDADIPKAIAEEEIARMMNEALTAAGVDPVIVYAHNKTGLLVSEENLHLMSDEGLREWQQAVEEARPMSKKNKA